MKNIPIAIPYLGIEEAQAAYDTVLSGWVTQGPKAQEFEEKFASYVGSKYAVAVSNCTSALHLSLIVGNVKAGDEVICPSMSFIATANSIRYLNAVPVFAEVDESYNLDIEDVKNKITSKTKAILLVHQIGMPANIDGFKELCQAEGLLLIEDAACAVGSAYKGRKIGSHSDLVCFSFHPRKVITTGDGGMIATSNEAYYERLKLLRQHGMSVNDRERHESKKIIFEEYLELGYNYRMTDIQAAIGIQQLYKLDGIIKRRREIAEIYFTEFKHLDCITLPIEKEGHFTNWQSYSVYLNERCQINRNDLMQKLANSGISTKKGIMNSHIEKAYVQKFKCNLPKSEDFSDRSILLPMYCSMDVETVKYITQNFIRNVLH